MLHHASEKGVFDLKTVVYETFQCMHRAGKTAFNAWHGSTITSVVHRHYLTMSCSGKCVRSYDY